MLLSNDRNLCIKALVNDVTAYDRTGLPQTVDAVYQMYTLAANGAPVHASPAAFQLSFDQVNPAPSLVSAIPEADAVVAMDRVVQSIPFELTAEGSKMDDSLPDDRPREFCICSKFPTLHPIHDEDD